MAHDPAFAPWLEQHGLQDTRCYSSVGKGWWPILDTMIRDLKAFGWTGEFDQIKEKFGTLRVYITQHGPIDGPVDMIINFAEHASSLTCEDCGEPGSVRVSNHIWYTKCEPCEEAYFKKHAKK